MKLILFSVACVLSIYAYCQSSQELFIKQVITVRFVNDQPLALGLRLSDTTDYKDDFLERTGYPINTEVLINLIHRSQVRDAGKWSDEELPNAFLVNSEMNMPAPSYFVKKYKPITQLDTIRLRDMIKDYEACLKQGGAYSYSKPIFDDSGKYAVLAFDAGHNLTGRGGINLYHFESGNWTELGPIKSWIH